MFDPLFFRLLDDSYRFQANHYAPFINDTFGHQTGDELLKITSQILLKLTRQEDIVARIGGYEFVILLPRTTEKQAQEMIGRIMDECKVTEFNGIKVSISLGVACKENPSLDICSFFLY
ncbi:MAG: GGDEF domain-containing protein [Syntrophomonadaceae bacterium]|nr:GGDEF domain-containing protein [Syntrophomonadaceae bacterium]